MKNIDYLYTDILIIGGGIAALRAADKAAQSGMNVTLVIKDAISSSSSITGFNAVLRGSTHKDNCSIYFDDTVTGGCHLNNPELVANLTCRTEASVHDLIDMGVRFDMDGDRLSLRQAAGSTVPRLVHYKDRIGSEIMGVLMKRLNSYSSVSILNNTIVVKLLKEDGVVRGALALRQETGEPVAIGASVTVIATGGVGNLYSFSTASRSISGDGYVLAKSAGARLRDMEFIQFEPFSFVYPEEIKGFNIPTAMFWDGAIMTNRLGEEFIPKDSQGRPIPLTKGDLCRRIMLQIKAGRGGEHGGVFFDIRHLPDHILSNYPQALNLFKQKGLFPGNAPFEVCPAYHYMMGGIEIDKKCNTRVPGLMAVGEATGGVHGAGRLSGNSGSEVIVFGAIAGEEAIRNAKRFTNRLDEKNVNESTEEYYSHFGTNMEDELQALEIERNICNIMQNKAGVLREGRLLSEGLTEIRSIANQIKALKAYNFSSYIKISAVKNMATIAEYVIRGALARTESRGDHFRLDFQDRDDLNLLKSIFC